MNVEGRPLADGCEVAETCLECPLAVCRYDIVGGLPTARRVTVIVNTGAVPPGTKKKHVFLAARIQDRGEFVDFLGIRLERAQAKEVARILLEVEQETGINLPSLRDKSRRDELFRARRVAARRMRMAGLLVNEIATLLQRDPSTISSLTSAI